MSKIEEPTLTSSAIRSTEISLERPRKYPVGLPTRLGIRCTECPRHCTIDLRLPNEFPSVYVGKIDGVFSLLCERVGKHQRPAEEQIGLPKVTYDASE